MQDTLVWILVVFMIAPGTAFAAGGDDARIARAQRLMALKQGVATLEAEALAASPAMAQAAAEHERLAAEYARALAEEVRVLSQGPETIALRSAAAEAARVHATNLAAVEAAEAAFRDEEGRDQRPRFVAKLRELAAAERKTQTELTRTTQRYDQLRKALADQSTESRRSDPIRRLRRERRLETYLKDRNRQLGLLNDITKTASPLIQELKSLDTALKATRNAAAESLRANRQAHQRERLAATRIEALAVANPEVAALRAAWDAAASTLQAVRAAVLSDLAQQHPRYASLKTEYAALAERPPAALTR